MDQDIVSNIERRRKYLKSDCRTILVNDLGARGAGKMKSRIRRVSDIAKHSALPLKYGILLSNMAAEFGKPFIVEFGTSLGFSTMYLATTSSDIPIYTIEGCSSSAGIAQDNFEMMGLNNIEIIHGSFEDKMEDIHSLPNKPGLIFIDGNHRKEPVLDYFYKLAEKSDSKTVIVIDDINYSKGMQEAWSEIKKHKKVTITIDIFRMGIVFFKSGIIPNNYIIRY
jgi:predicted O-methyltransferase YrrM